MMSNPRFRFKDIARVVLCTVFIGFPYLVLFHTHGGFQFISQTAISERWRQFLYGSDDWLKPDGNQTELSSLRGVLEAAATPEKNVIITTLNAAWAAENTMIDLFLDSFRKGDNISHLLNHLVIVALDEVSYNRCIHIHAHCYRLRTKGVDFADEKPFMTSDYLKMMWRRIEFLRIVMQLGYNFVFTDADVMWFRDPFPRFDSEADFQIACDMYKGDPTDLHNAPNGGFLYVRSNRRTMEFYKYWHASRLDHPKMHDQDVFNTIKGNKRFRKIGIKVFFLDTLYFGGFCEESKDLEKVCTMHANCCVMLQRKLGDLRLVMEDWKSFRELTPEQKKTKRILWRAPRECLKSF